MVAVICFTSSNISSHPYEQINSVNRVSFAPKLKPKSLEGQCTSFHIKGLSHGTAVIISHCVLNFTYLVNVRGWGEPLTFAHKYCFTLGF